MTDKQKAELKSVLKKYGKKPKNTAILYTPNEQELMKRNADLEKELEVLREAAQRVCDTWAPMEHAKMIDEMRRLLPLTERHSRIAQ